MGIPFHSASLHTMAKFHNAKRTDPQIHRYKNRFKSKISPSSRAAVPPAIVVVAVALIVHRPTDDGFNHFLPIRDLHHNYRRNRHIIAPFEIEGRATVGVVFGFARSDGDGVL